ncbi:MAG: hypothetical protein K0R38_428 [Polyangiaceae bacterium]|jgi:hypothetical protein|nr:hypothetical protein [Polyangiaceae bacterium]
MKACCVTAHPSRPSASLEAWQRALGAAWLGFDELCALALSCSPVEPFSYDLVLLSLSPESVSWVEPLHHLLEHRPGVALAVWVDEALPEAARELASYRRALSAADCVICSQYSRVREVFDKTAIRAADVAAPWLGPTPTAYLSGGARPARRGRPTFGVVAAPGRPRVNLLRELGAAAYAWLRLRYRLRFHAPTDAPAKIAESELVYLPAPLLDGGALAAHCAESGAILLAPRAYDPARFCFPYTCYGPEPGRAGALVLWLLNDARSAAFFREHAAHRARQLSDGDCRLQLARVIQLAFPRFACPPDAARPALLDHIHHVSGAVDLNYAEHECIVVCLVRNGGEHLPSFLEHYRGLGVRRFVFVDNGSDDGSRAALEREPDVTVYETSLPHKHYENELRRLIIERHCQGRWCLNVDVDELFDYPGSEALPLGSLLGYLRTRGATALVAYLLDMFAERNAFGAARAVDLKSEYPYYDLDDVDKVGYFAPEVANFCDHNELPSPTIGCYFGGIRGRVFGSRERSQFLLTKHPLVFLDGALKPVVHPHYSNRARLADVTGVLLHYKLTPAFKTKVGESVRSARYVEFAQHQYDDYQKRLAPESELLIRTPGRRRYGGAWALVEQGFLHASRGYRAYFEERGAVSEPRASHGFTEPGAKHG